LDQFTSFKVDKPQARMMMFTCAKLDDHQRSGRTEQEVADFRGVMRFFKAGRLVPPNHHPQQKRPPILREMALRQCGRQGFPTIFSPMWELATWSMAPLKVLHCGDFGTPKATMVTAASCQRRLDGERHHGISILAVLIASENASG
jgi:hypothetical protein